MIIILYSRVQILNLFVNYSTSVCVHIHALKTLDIKDLQVYAYLEHLKA